MFLQFLAAKFKLVKKLSSLKFTESFISPPCKEVYAQRFWPIQRNLMDIVHNRKGRIKANTCMEETRPKGQRYILIQNTLSRNLNS